ncbi:hypothetical protein R1sor_027207 [Riccia sorocarpa]|uniref:Reverse transcriptase domain-containing protein n=1 Tax=Riccia sorocarpa TaxID=122646 RepID=A0ABD3GHS6_9MARC
MAEARKQWFDESCWASRQKALASSGAERTTAFRAYKSFIRSKRRRFLCEQQSILSAELRKYPQRFWSRLRSRSSQVELPQDVLQNYITTLYSFPDASEMFKVSEAACSFSELEVANELCNIGVGKAADMAGLTIELLKWGGPTLLTLVTSLLNTAVINGFPLEWAVRKVVPLFKSCAKDDLKNYRTIMIGSTFAKLFGRLIEVRLSSWCESQRVRAPSQAGFRRQFSTLDHLLTLQVLMEQAKRKKQTLFVLFVDFSKAFDLVSRSKLHERLIEMEVPPELINAVVTLYQRMKMKISSKGVAVDSTLGVIQGCPLSPTLFGLLIDKFHWMCEQASPGVAMGAAMIRLLIFADDVALFADSEAQMQTQIHTLEQFYAESGMRVNLAKTRWLRVGSSQEVTFTFQGQKIEEDQSYRYLGLEFTTRLCWRTCVEHRVTNGLRAFFTLWIRCKEAGLIDWSLKAHLFSALVRAVVLYGAPIWGPSLAKTKCRRVEMVQKTFLQQELGVRVQVPYVILLAETGRLPLEAEALFSAIQFARRLGTLVETRYATQAKSCSLTRGWFADICTWAASWGFSTSFWGEEKTLRDRFHEAVVRRSDTLWRDIGPVHISLE